MKTRIINILFFLSIFLPGFGQEDAPFVTLGYCNGINGEQGEITSSTAEKVNAAIAISPEMTKLLAGNSITAVRIYLPSKLNISSLTAWTRSSLDGENLTEMTVKSKSLEKGWNEVELETPFVIPAGENFYLGYTLVQKKRSYGICCTGVYQDGGLFYQFDDEGWLTDATYGNLCMEGIVKGDNLPKLDIALTSAVMEPLYYIGEDFDITLTLANRATKTVKNFELAYDIENVGNGSVHIECDLPSRGVQDIKVTLPGVDMESLQDVTLTLTVSTVNGEADENSTNNSVSILFNSTDKTYRKVVLFEEFTTESCGNCPIAAPIVAEAIEKFEEKYPHTVAMICHHSGFYTDFMTTPHDEEYLFLYGGTTYAPAIMIDRYHGDGKCPVFQVTSVENVMKDIEEAYNRHPEVALEVEGYYDEPSGKVFVDVKGMRVFAKDGLPLRINVVVTEDNIPQRQQNGAPLDYIHNHVMRTTNSTWGDIIEWADNDFSYSCTLEIAEDWVKENLEVIVYVSTYDEGNNTNCAVENARKIRLTELSSINELTDSSKALQIRAANGTISVNAPYVITEVSNINGTKCDPIGLRQGVYIVKATDGKRIFTRKVAVK